MSNGEVQFYKDKEFQLPKRCKCCRDKKNKTIKTSIYKGKIGIQHSSSETTKAYCGETAMQKALKKSRIGSIEY